MAIKRFSDMQKDANPEARRASLVQRIAASAKGIKTSIDKTEATINKAYEAFEDAKRVFTPAQVRKAVLAFDKMNQVLTSHIRKTYSTLRTAIKAEIPNDRLSTQLEDLYALKAKLAVLRAQAMGSLGEDMDEDMDEEFVELDESGYVVDAEDPVEEIVEEEPMVDEEATEEVATEVTAEDSTLEQDNDSGFDMTTDTETEPETHADNPVDRAEEAAPGAPEETDPPSRSQEATEEVATEEVATEEVATEEVATEEVTAEEEIEEVPEEEVATEVVSEEETDEITEENLEEVMEDVDVEDLETITEEEELPAEEMEIEMEESGIDEALATEIFGEDDDFMNFDDDTDEIEATASLKDKKIASAKRTGGNSGLTEDSLLTSLMDQEMAL